MKKIALTIGMALMAALIMVGTPAEAQTRQQKKDAKKEAKRLTKEGYKTMLAPLETQLLKFYVNMDKTGNDGMPKYLVATMVVTGQTYAAAQMAGQNQAKIRLAKSIGGNVMAEFKNSLANTDKNSVDAASLDVAMEKATEYTAQRMGQMIVAQEYYKVLPNKNYEYHVVLLYDKSVLNEMIIDDMRNELKKMMDEWTPEYERMLKEAGVKGIQ